MVFYSQLTSAISENKDATFEVASFSFLPPEQLTDLLPKTCIVQQDPVPTRIIAMESKKMDSKAKPKVEPEVKVLMDSKAKPKVEPEVKVLMDSKAKPKVEPEVKVLMDSKAKRGMDPIVIGLDLCDPMYTIATQPIKQSLERTEAQRLEGMLDSLYKSESGRSRGWIKTHLTTFLLPRAASGASVHTKDTFCWDNLRTDKQASAALDFVCLAKGIRVAVWYEDTKEIYVWPAADSSSSGSPPLYHMSSYGAPLQKQTVLENGWTLYPPLSVVHSLEKLTLTELHELAKKIGIPELIGKKTECIKQIASERTKLRFVGSPLL